MIRRHARQLCRAARATSLALAVALAPALPLSAQGLDLDGMTAEQRQIFRDEVRAYLMENPEVLLEAIAVLEARQAQHQTMTEAEAIATHRAAIFEDGYSWVGGNPDGDVTLVEFLDYRCSFCRRAHPEVAELLERDGNIRLIVKEFPILGPDSTLSSRFAIAVMDIGGPDAYEVAHDRLMTMRARVTEGNLSQLATDLGLDPAAVLARMEDDDVTRIIEANHALAQQLQISGTPTFILEDQFLRGYAPLGVMESLVAEARGG